LIEMTTKHVPAAVRGAPVRIQLEPIYKRVEPVDKMATWSLAIVGLFALLGALYVMCDRLGDINAAMAPV